MQNPFAPLLAAAALAGAAGAQTYGVAQLEPPSPWTVDFGRVVDLSGTRAIVGSSNGAWIVERVPSGSWSTVAELAPPVPAASFGTTVALDGDRAVVGAYADPGSGSGSIYVFERAGDGTWALDAQLFLPALPSGSWFGRALALDGDRLAVGAPLAPSPFGPELTGTVHVFDRLPSGAWALDATLGVPGLAQNAQLGAAIDVHGDRVVAGAPLAGDATGGRAFLFERGTNGAWQQAAELTPPAGVTLEIFDRFGNAVAIHGNRAAVGAPAYDGSGPTSGGAWVFAEQTGGAWPPTQALTPPGLAAGDRLGADLHLSATQLVVGASESDAGGALDSGAAHRWRLGAGGHWFWQEELAPIDPESDQASGSAVAFDSGWVVLGAAGGTGRVDVLYSYGASGEAAPDNYGKGTAACDGLPSLSATLPALIASGDFRLRGDNAPPDAVGLAVLGLGQDAAGSDPFGLGVQLHVDVLSGPPPLLLSAASDATGFGEASVPIPASTSLVGAKLFAQVLWIDLACAPPSLGLSTSDGLSLVIAEP